MSGIITLKTERTGCAACLYQAELSFHGLTGISAKQFLYFVFYAMVLVWSMVNGGAIITDLLRKLLIFSAGTMRELIIELMSLKFRPTCPSRAITVHTIKMI